MYMIYVTSKLVSQIIAGPNPQEPSLEALQNDTKRSSILYGSLCKSVYQDTFSNVNLQ